MSSEEQRNIKTQVSGQTERKVWTLTQLNQSLENLFQERFGNTSFWITCEITKVDVRGRHRYLELADSVDGIKTAQSRAAIWGSQFDFIRKTVEKAGEDVNKVIAPGNNVLVNVTLNFHKVFGLSLTIVNLDPAFTLGDIERQKQETLKKLQKEGLLEKQKALYLPTLAKRIALIGSPETSGYTDFLRELTHNDIYTNFVVKEFHSRVQGEGAVREITRAIRSADLFDVDTIVLVRGGGSKMDLHTFNHYDICKAIANAQHPVVTGIGHETDLSLADIVAHHYEKTPTAAAKSFYMKIGVFSSELRQAFDAVKFAAFSALQQESKNMRMINTTIHSRVMNNLRVGKERLQLVSDRLVRMINTEIRDHRESLTRRINQIQSKLSRIIHDKNASVVQLQKQIYQASLFSLKSKAEHIDRKDELIQTFALYTLKDEHNRLALLNQKIAILDPTRLLSRGYTVSTVEGKELKDIESDIRGKTMKTLTKTKVFYSKIEDFKNLDDDRKGD